MSVFLAGHGAGQEPSALQWVEAHPGVFLARSNTALGNPSTVVITGSDATVLVDPNLPRVEGELRSFLEEVSVSHGSGRYIAATHAHGDHAGGLVWSAPLGQVVGTPGNRARLAGPAVVRGEESLPQASLPQLVFPDSLRLQVATDLSVMLFSPSVPGHTDGDLFAYIPEAQLLYAGDYLFLDRLPIIDVAEGGTLQGYLATIQRLASTLPAETRVYPGHGTFGLDEIRTISLDEWRAWAITVLDAAHVVLSALDAGTSRDSIVAIGPPQRLSHLVERPRYVGWERWVDQLVALRDATGGDRLDATGRLMSEIPRSAHPVYDPDTGALDPCLTRVWNEAQVVSVGEWHGFGNTWEVLKALTDRGRPFDLVGLEVGRFTGALLDSVARDGAAGRTPLVLRHPFAVPFYWWTEPWDLVAGTAREHGATLFGFDREFAWSARLHFDLIQRDAAVSALVAPWASRAKDAWRRYVAGEGQPLMMDPVMDSLDDLVRQLGNAGAFEAAARVGELRASSWIDRRFRDDPLGSNLARSRLAQRRVAEAMDVFTLSHGVLPRTLTISGLMHAPRGTNFIGLADLGTLVGTVAASHDTESLHVLLLPVRGVADATGPGGARTVGFDAITALGRYVDISPFVAQVGDVPVYFDLTRLRPEAIRTRTGRAREITRLIESFDALILLPDGTPATLSEAAGSPGAVEAGR